MIALLLTLLSAPSSATVPDKFGIGGRWQGAGGGGVAVVDDGTAALLNPAGLAKVRRPTAAAGISFGIPRFAKMPPLWWDTNRDGLVDEADAPLDFPVQVDPLVGIQLQVARNIGGKFGLGLTAYVPTRGLIRFSTFEPNLPNWFMWSNRPQRYVFAAGVGGDILPGLAVGAAVDVLAKAQVDLKLVIDAGIQGPDSTTQGTEDLVGDVVMDLQKVELALVPALAPVLGLQWDVGQAITPLDGLVLGASYRGAVGLDIRTDLDLQANLSAEDVGSLDPFVTAIVVETVLGMNDHYQPTRVALGAAWQRSDTLFVYADARWTDWSKMSSRMSIAQVQEATISSPLLDISDKVVDGNDYSVVLKSTWSLRMGSDLRLPQIELSNAFKYLQFSVRGGFGFEPTPLVSQGPSSAMLDSDRSLFTLGLGLETFDPAQLVDGPLRLDLFFQYHAIASQILPRQSEVPRAGFPIGTAGLPLGGSVMMIGAQFGFDY